MYWLQRPPYLRWAAAAILIVGAAAWDFRPEPTDLVPFLIGAVPAGDPIEEADLEWREVPAGIVVAPNLSHPVAAVDLRAGDPLLASMLRGRASIPEGWWEVPVTIGPNAAA